MKRSSLFSAVTVFVVFFAAAISALAQPYLAVNGANHDYRTLNYYINEPDDAESLSIEFWPNEGNVAEAQIWSNLGRREYATLDDQDAAGVPGPSPAGTNYFVGFPLSNAGGGKWEATMPINKTGAYRLTARYRLNGQSEWKWVGGRDTAVMVSPKKARDVILYELQVNVINATGDDFSSRSTFEDLMNPAKPANLDYFEELGVNTLWIQPIHPVGNHDCIDKSQGPGSPYSIQNMWEVAPHMSQGNTREAAMAAFTNFAAEAGARGIDFFFDIIFNHTSWDAEIGRDPDDPTQPAANPTALIRDILPQWYSRYVGGLSCDQSPGAWNQDDYHFWLPAQNAGQMGPAPAERIDFGKWPDVADLFWGEYPALYNPHTDTDAYWNVDQPGADVKRMTEYFAYFGEYWIEKSGGTLGGFRCDYAQGLPPQAWEYFVNRIRTVKWDFIFMAESLDGGNVSKRAGRHMDIINQNWVWQVLGGGGNTSGLRGAIDENKTSYGFAGIMRGIINHDQNAPDDIWYSFSRYAVGAVVDGAPQMYQGQELGYRNGYGFSRFRVEHDRAIPDIFKWFNMQTLWNTRINELEESYKRVNRARMRNESTRLHDQWYLDQVGGNGVHQQIFSVLKYDRFGWDPAHQSVVLNFVNLQPWTAHSGTFDLASVGAIYINPTRTYNVRNLMADDDQAYLWGDGRTGQDIIDNGVYVLFSSSPITDPASATVQMLVLEEHGGNQPFDPWVSWDPEAPEGCETVTIRYRKADSPLGAGPVYIHIGRNGWNDTIEPNPQMANDGDYWVYNHNVLPGTEELNFAFNDGADNWDSNSGQDWNVTVADCEGPVLPVVWTDPEAPEGCDPITIYYDASTRVLAAANPVYIHVGHDGWNGVIAPAPAMTSEGDGVWSYVYTPPPGTEEVNVVFNNGGATWDNNGGLDWHIAVVGCEGAPPPPTGFVITNPASAIAVAYAVDSYTLHGIAEDMEGQIDWTNSLTGASGSMPHADPWVLSNVALAVGANTITLSGTALGSPVTETNAMDSAAAYGSGQWADGSNQGFGFGAWSINAQGTSGTFAAMDGWGMWSEATGNGVEAIRPFSAPLSEGDTVHVRMKNGWIWEDGGTLGVSVRNGSGDAVWFLSFTGGDTHYASPAGLTDIGWTDAGLDIAFTVTGATTFEVTVTPVGGGAVREYSGSFSGSITDFRAWSWDNGTNDGNNSNRDFFINNLMITSESIGDSEPVETSVTITRLEDEGQDSNGDGVPDSFYIQHGLDHTDPDVGQTPAPNGYTYKASYVMELNPNDEETPPLRMLVNGSGSFTFEAPAGGRRYLLQFTADLGIPFQDVGEVQIGAEIEENGAPLGFYRVRFLGMD